MMSKKHKSSRTTQAIVQRATPIQRHFSYSSQTRTLTLNGHSFFNVGGDWLNKIYGG